MKKTTNKQQLESYYQIKIPPETYSYLLVLDNVTDKSVVTFVTDYCSREFNMIYTGQANTIIGRRRKRRGKK
jgi:hypothetical protein